MNRGILGAPWRGTTPARSSLRRSALATGALVVSGCRCGLRLNRLQRHDETVVVGTRRSVVEGGREKIVPSHVLVQSRQEILPAVGSYLLSRFTVDVRPKDDRLPAVRILRVHVDLSIVKKDARDHVLKAGQPLVLHDVNVPHLIGFFVLLRHWPPSVGGIVLPL